METFDSEKLLESTPPSPPTIIICPRCHTPWSADYDDYRWMRDTDLLFCSCGKALCEVQELKEG